MERRVINIPLPISLRDPESGDHLRDSSGNAVWLDFGGFLAKLMHNPMWGESFDNMKAQNEILESAKTSQATGQVTKMYLKDETWRKLKEAVERPRYELIHPVAGRQIIAGYGFHASMASQLLPMAMAIVEAELEIHQKALQVR